MWSKIRSAGLLRHLSVFGTATATSGLLVWNCQQFEASCDAKGKPKVFSWGSGQYGQIGQGHELDEPLPTQIEVLSGLDIVRIHAGAHQSACLTKDGQVYTFGRGENARLGHGVSGGMNEGIPRLVEELGHKKIVRISPGYVHMGAVSDDGELWTWGKDSFRQLGHGKSDYPKQVDKLKGTPIADVACGRNHTLALTNDGKVFSFGGAKDGCTGHGQKKGTPTPTQIQALSNNEIVQISAGYDFSAFLTKSGDVYTCGCSDYGQTGHGRGSRYTTTPQKVRGLPSNVAQISAGQYHVVASTDDGKLFTWGFNNNGQLGHGDTANRNTPAQVTILDSEKITAVSAGGGHSACQTASGKVYMFGRGRAGQLGRANKVESIAAYRAEPVELDYFAGHEVQQVSLGADHSLALAYVL